jgi:(1->4)-alpha-D-glucan 1-alpha-D-glucosylmutase
LPSGIAPTANDEVLVYQTLIGAWPLAEQEIPDFRERFERYLEKALREAKTQTSWWQPNEEYERAVKQFAASITDYDTGNRFLSDFLRLQAKISWYGMLNSLSQLLLKVASPGVPDFYQGSTLWDFSLVDPDNRRPVDYDAHARVLEAVNAVDDPAELMAMWRTGAVKMFVTARALKHQEWLRGEYMPLEVVGPRKDKIVAFARRGERGYAVVAVPRLLMRFVPQGRLPVGSRVWRATAVLPPPEAPSRWTNAFTGEVLTAAEGIPGPIRVADLLSRFPVALLVGGA